MTPPLVVFLVTVHTVSRMEPPNRACQSAIQCDRKYDTKWESTMVQYYPCLSVPPGAALDGLYQLEIGIRAINGAKNYGEYLTASNIL